MLARIKSLTICLWQESGILFKRVRKAVEIEYASLATAQNVLREPQDFAFLMVEVGVALTQDVIKVHETDIFALLMEEGSAVFSKAALSLPLEARNSALVMVEVVVALLKVV